MTNDDMPPPGEKLPSQHHAPQSEALLRRVHDIISTARPMPLSASVMISRDEVLELLEEAINRLPDELRAARWLLREREEFLTKVKGEGEDILAAARARAERMVQKTEVVKSAEARAKKIVESAESESRRVRHETEDYCDQRLASFEIVLERTLKVVGQGRAKLQGAGPKAPTADEQPAASERPEGFFDQDES